jgi:deoxyribonuclease V
MCSPKESKKSDVPEPGLDLQKSNKFSVEKLFKEIQCQLSRIEEKEESDYISPDKVRVVAASDVSYSGSHAITALVQETLESGQRETVVSVDKVASEYAPSIFIAREAPPILATLRSLPRKPELLIINAHGVAHPRKCGLATYIGKVCNIPTMGAAKALLAGRLDASGWVTMGMNEKVGYSIKKPSSQGAAFFVSPGYRVRVEDVPRFVSLLSKARSGFSSLWLLEEAHALSVHSKKEFEGCLKQTNLSPLTL